MKILYGVQATGNGHITRARIMLNALKKTGLESQLEIDWFFSGRKADQFFDMDGFADYRIFRGMTFAVDDGRINFPKTVLTNNLFKMIADIKNLDVSQYDLVISDFEPVSAWAAKLAGKPSIGISHQNAFLFDIPQKGRSFISDFFMRYFAPVERPIGVHWHHFDSPILPPIIDTNEPEAGDDFVLVYLPFVHLETALKVLDPHPQQRFVIYSNVAAAMTRAGHIEIKPFSREGFQRDLRACRAVISGGGFELPSEALHLGKRLLIQPVKGQMEQQSNGLVLQQLNLATVVDEFTEAAVADWLSLPPAPRHIFPHTAEELLHWLAAGDWSDESFSRLKERLWGQVESPQLGLPKSSQDNNSTAEVTACS